MVLIKSYSQPPINEKEVLRYAGCKGGNAEIAELLDECKAEADGKFSYKVCYLPLTVKVTEDFCDFGVFCAKSADLAKNLDGCRTAVIFAATVGVAIDRLISKYSTVSPAKALIFDAIGTERTETLCDLFCEDISKELKTVLKPRFSPGYGDLDLSLQKDIFSVLNCQKHIGLTVTGSLIMSPSKSVTAIVGLYDGDNKNISCKCDTCKNKECLFRSDL